MSTPIKIANAADFVGQEVTLKGWVQKRIDKGKLQFVSLRDGSGVMQCIVFKKNLPEEQFEAARYITLEFGRGHQRRAACGAACARRL